MAHIVVVGGGIAGLACAWRLSRAGHAVEVIEREAVPGGRMRSERHGAFVVDRGAQFIASAYRNLQRIAREVGVAERIHPVRRARNAVLRSGRFEPGDYDAPAIFLRSRLLSWRAKLGLARLAFDLVRKRRYLDPWHPECAAPIDREDMASYLRRVAGEEAAELLLGPAFSATFDSDPEDLSGAFALLAVRLLAGGFRLQCFAGGMGALSEALAARLAVRVGWEVQRVESAADGARIHSLTPDGVREERADAVVVAVPGTRVAALCATLTAAERTFFDQVRYVRGIVAFLMLEKAPATLPFYGVAFPRTEGLGLYGLAVDHHKVGVAPEGAGLVNASLSAEMARRLWRAEDAAVIEAVLADLARTPIGRLEPQASAVHRWDPMLPQFHAGYLPALARFLAREERSPRLAFAGDYLVGPYTEAALTSGLRAANEVAQLLP
jgi:protoporphyrinogen/coproporphyrinogen III oxidase